MPDCREVARIVSTDALTAEPRWRRVMLGLHLWHCDVCARFARQLERIREALREAWRVPPGADVEALKRRVIARLGAP